MNDEKRMIGNYAVEQSIHIGKKKLFSVSINVRNILM